MATEKLIAYAALQTSLTAADQARADALAAGVQAQQAAADAQTTVSAQVQRVDGAIAETQQATEELRSVAGVQSLGREPQAGDPAGIYRVGIEDVAWDGQQVTGRTEALATAAASVATVPNIAALLAYRGEAQSVVVTDPQYGGTFSRDAAVHTPDGALTYRDPSQPYGWRRQNVAVLNPLHFGMKGDGGLVPKGQETDNAPAYNKMIDTIEKNGMYYVVVECPPSPGYFAFKSQTRAITHHYITFKGQGKVLTRWEGQHPSALIQAGRAPGTNDTNDAGMHTSGISFERMQFRHPYLIDDVVYRPGTDTTPPTQGYTQDAELLRLHPDKYLPSDPDPENMEKYVIFDLRNCSTITLTDVDVGGCYQFAWFGGAENGRGYISNIRFSNVTGWSYNRGLHPVRVRHGAGFYWDGGTYFVNVLHPRYSDIVVDGVTRRFYEDMLTRANMEMFLIEGVPGAGEGGGGWDTWRLSGITFERMSGLYRFALPPGQTMTYARHTNIVCDYMRAHCLNFEGLNGAVSDFDCGNMYMTAWEGRNVYMPHTPGYIIEFKATAAKMYLAGEENIYISHRNMRDVQFNGGSIYAGQRLNGSTPYTHPTTGARGVLLDPKHATGTAGGFAIYIGPNVQGVSFANMRINEYHGGSTPYSAGYGLYLGADADGYSIIGNAIFGRVLGAVVGNNGAGSRRRRVQGNQIERWVEAAQDIVTQTPPASGATWTNTTPFSVRVSIGGGAVTQIRRNELVLPNISGEITVAPGDSLTLTYTAAPTFIVQAQQ